MSWRSKSFRPCWWARVAACCLPARSCRMQARCRACWPGSMAAAPRFKATSRLHFKRIAARAMRQVLIEAARRRSADKRGGRGVPLSLDESIADPVESAGEIVALDTALDDLSRLNPRQAATVEYRFFGGLDVAETAELLGVSEATVLRDWRAARAWLATELRNRAG